MPIKFRIPKPEFDRLFREQLSLAAQPWYAGAEISLESDSSSQQAHLILITTDWTATDPVTFIGLLHETETSDLRDPAKLWRAVRGQVDGNNVWLVPIAFQNNALATYLGSEP